MERGKEIDHRGRIPNVNFQSSYTKMTALHWCAYNNDKNATQYLLDNKAKETLNRDGNAPADVAGFCKNWEVISVYFEHFDARIQVIIQT